MIVGYHMEVVQDTYKILRYLRDKPCYHVTPRFQGGATVASRKAIGKRASRLIIKQVQCSLL